MIKALVKPHFLKCSQCTHGVDTSHATPLDDQADGVGFGLSLSFLIQETPSFMSDVILCLRRRGHEDERTRVYAELNWRIPKPEGKGLRLAGKGELQ